MTVLKKEDMFGPINQIPHFRIGMKIRFTMKFKGITRIALELTKKATGPHSRVKISTSFYARKL